MAIDPKININENQVIFRRDVGHKHDGLTSSLIDGTKYSIFDFNPFVNATGSSSRKRYQENNLNLVKTFIVNTVEERVLNPQGIKIQANAITAREIVSATITANEIAANTITANEIAANTITANELVSNIILVNNSIQSNTYSAGTSGWKIFSNGFAEFGNIIVRGNVGGWIVNNTTIYAGDSPSATSTYTSLNSNGTAIFYNYTNNFPNPSVYTEVKINRVGITVSGNADSTYDTVIDSNQTMSYYLKGYDLQISEGYIDVSCGIGSDINESSSGQDASGGWLSASGFATFTRPGSCLFLNHTTSSNTSQSILSFKKRGSDIASISISNTSVAYGTGSDERLKFNIQQILDIEELINKLNPIKFNWVSEPTDWSHGFIAHELEEVAPYAVVGDRGDIDENGNPIYQQVDYSKITPILAAGVKMLLEKVNNLESRLKALEDV